MNSRIQLRLGNTRVLWAGKIFNLLHEFATCVKTHQSVLQIFVTNLLHNTTGVILCQFNLKEDGKSWWFIQLFIQKKHTSFPMGHVKKYFDMLLHTSAEDMIIAPICTANRWRMNALYLPTHCWVNDCKSGNVRAINVHAFRCIFIWRNTIHVCI